jgi:hypothetical protein
VEKQCPEGSEKVDGECKPISSTAGVNEIEPTLSINKTTTIRIEKPLAVKTTTKKFGSCPEGMEHGEHGICKTVKVSETSIVDTETITQFNNDTRGEVNLMGCPEGTKRDQEGSCLEIKSSNKTKTITDLKILLKKDGSCPDNYKMVEGRCLYVKPKTNSTLPLSNLPPTDISRGVQPRDGKGGTSQSELVPVLRDNSCPEGTEYSEYGLCQKLTRPSNSKIDIQSNHPCPDGLELVNGQCTRKNSPNPTEFTTSTDKSESTTTGPRPIDRNESSESTEKKSNTKSSSKQRQIALH